MGAVTKQALRVYVALSNLGQRDGDVLDALIPFFEPILRQLDGAIFDPSVFAAGVRKLYNWRFTSDVAKEFVPRLVRKGYLERLARTTGHVVRYTPPPNLEDAAPEALGIISEILDVFENYPSKITDLFHFSRTREQLEDILIRFLVSLNAYSEDFFRVQVARLGEDVPKNSSSITIEEGGRELTTEERYISARFLKDIVSTKPEFVPYLTRLASIGLLTEVVEDFVKPTSVADASDLIIFLDAPMALHYLGLSGKAIQTDVKNVLDSLKTIGCKLMMFPESCEEMGRNLSSMLSRPAPNRIGYTHEAMRRGEVSEQYVIAVRNNPELAVENEGITIRNFSLGQFPGLHPNFPAEAYEDFLSTITWVKEVEPREHDAKCTAYIMRLRESRSSSDLFRCKYVFATNNPKFAREARKYCRQAQMIQERQWGPVVHLVDLATLAWLRTGLHESEIVPRGRLVGVCDRVLQLRPEVTTAVYQKLSEVVTSEKLKEYELLLTDQRSVRMLMDQTVGNSHVVTSENVEQLFEQMRLATVEEVTEIYDRKLAEQSKKHFEAAHNLEAERKAQLLSHDAEISALTETARLEREAAKAHSDMLAVQARELKLKLSQAETDDMGRLDSVLVGNNRILAAVNALILCALLLIVSIAAIGAGLSFVEMIARNWLVIGSIILIGLVSGYALWAALTDRRINFVRIGLDAVGRALLLSRASKRVSGSLLSEQLPNIRFDNGQAVRTSVLKSDEDDS